MPERVIAPATYATVLIVLLALTVVTIGASFLDLGGSTGHIAFGLTIAVTKASLVVLFFMHVLHSNRLTWTVIAIAVFWLGFFLTLTLSDYYTRGWFGPGH